MSENEVQGQDEGIKLFGEWSFEGIEVRDIGLKRYLNVDPVYLPHTGGRHEARKFRKSNLSIVERLINNLLKPGSSGGAKGRVTSSVKTVARRPRRPPPATAAAPSARTDAAVEEKPRTE